MFKCQECNYFKTLKQAPSVLMAKYVESKILLKFKKLQRFVETLTELFA